MFLNYLPFLHFFNAIAFLYLLVFILYKDSRSWINRTSAIFLACFSIWSLGSMFVNGLAQDEFMAMAANNFSCLGWIGFAPAFYIFTLVFAKKKRFLKSKLLYIILFGLALTFAYKQWTGYMLVDYIRQPYGWIYHWSDSIWASLFNFYYALLLLCGFCNLLLYKKRTKFAMEKKQINIIVFAGFFAFIFGSISNVALPRLGVYFLPPIADVVALAWALGVVYAMVRYKFLGITPALAAENIISNMSDVLVLVDLAGNIKTVNQATLSLLGYKKEELIGQPVDVIFTKNNFQEELMVIVEKDREIKNEDIKLRSKDRSGIPVVFSGKPLKDEITGDIIGIVCLARDITDLKKTEEQLEEKVKELKDSEKSISEAYNDLTLLEKEVEGEHDRIAAIVSNFDDPIIFVNSEGRVQLFNPAATKILGIKDGAMDTKIAKSHNYSLENFSKIISRRFKVKDSGDSKTIGINEEEVVVKHEDQDLTYRVVTKKVMDRDAFLGTMKIFHNLTREKEIDKLKSEFITIAAHQLRTPLSAIKWVIKLVLDKEAGDINEEQKELLTKGYKSNERIINLVNDMLNVSRIEEGRFGYAFVSDNFIDLLKEVIENTRNQLEKKKIKFSLEAPGRLAKFSFDRSKLTLVLQNLLENAIKYTPENGRIKVKVSVGKKYLKVSISDNGVGIPKEDQKKLFTKFFRAENVMRMQTEGSGLGLFMAKNIINKHGGDITYKSEEGKGSEFIFTLPIK